jgi:hypothetical protein
LIRDKLRLSGISLCSFGANNAGQLTGRSLQYASQFCGRRIDKSDKLTAQLVQRRQRRQIFDTFSIEDSSVHNATKDFEIVIFLGKFGGDFRGSDRIVRIGNGGRADEIFADRLRLVCLRERA